MSSDSQKRNERIAVIIMLVFGITALVYAYTQQMEATHTMNLLLESKEEQVFEAAGVDKDFTKIDFEAL